MLARVTGDTEVTGVRYRPRSAWTGVWVLPSEFNGFAYCKSTGSLS